MSSHPTAILAALALLNEICAGTRQAPLGRISPLFTALTETFVLVVTLSSLSCAAGSFYDYNAYWPTVPARDTIVKSPHLHLQPATQTKPYLLNRQNTTTRDFLPNLVCSQIVVTVGGA